jgi:hypothetical protein
MPKLTLKMSRAWNPTTATMPNHLPPIVKTPTHKLKKFSSSTKINKIIPTIRRGVPPRLSLLVYTIGWRKGERPLIWDRQRTIASADPSTGGRQVWGGFSTALQRPRALLRVRRRSRCRSKETIRLEARGCGNIPGERVVNFSDLGALHGNRGIYIYYLGGFGAAHHESMTRACSPQHCTTVGGEWSWKNAPSKKELKKRSGMIRRSRPP